MEVKEFLHPEIVADLTTTSDVFSSKWYGKYLRSNPWVKYQKENHILYSGEIDKDGHLGLEFNPERGYRFVYKYRNSKHILLLFESHDWEEMKKRVHLFFEMCDYLKANPTLNTL